MKTKDKSNDDVKKTIEKVFSKKCFFCDRSLNELLNDYEEWEEDQTINGKFYGLICLEDLKKHFPAVYEKAIASRKKLHRDADKIRKKSNTWKQDYN